VESEWHQAGCNIKVQYQGAISRINQREIKEDSKEVLARGAPSARGGRGKEARKGRKEKRKKGRKEEKKKVRAASRLRPRAGAGGHFLGHPREAERAARLAAISRITLSQRRNRIGRECRAHRPNPSTADASCIGSQRSLAIGQWPRCPSGIDERGLVRTWLKFKTFSRNVLQVRKPAKSP
jgi:hypothetical protein